MAEQVNQNFSNRDILDKIVTLNIADKDQLREFYNYQFDVIELFEFLSKRWLITEEWILTVAKSISNNSIPVVTSVDGMDYRETNIYLQNITKELFFEMINPQYELERLRTFVYKINHFKKEIYIATPIFPVKEIWDEIRKFKASSEIIKKINRITFIDENLWREVVDDRNLVDYSFHINIAPLGFMNNILAANESIDSAINKWNKLLIERARRSWFDTYTEEEKIVKIEGNLAELNDTMSWQVAKLLTQWEQWFDGIIASDIHIEPNINNQGGYIRYRVNGSLSAPVQIDNIDAIINEIKTKANIPVNVKNTKQDGALNILLNWRKYSYRVSLMPMGSKEKEKQKLVMRELTDDISRLDLKKNKMDWKFREILERLLGAPKDWKVGKFKDGLFLMTWPTGSGKSTTIMSILNSLNTIDVNIITLEDPIEYRIPWINQSQIFNPDGNKEWVNPDEFYSFQEAIEASLRQDPDIIFIWEIRNSTTMTAAKVTAMTWHIVLSTLHTNNTFETLERIVWLWIEPDSIASFIRLIMAQRLSAQVCNSCRREYNDPIFSASRNDATKREIDYIKKKIEIYSALADTDYITELPDNIKDLKIYKWMWCSACNYTGLWKRVGIYEFLEIDNEIQEFLSAGKIQKTKTEVRELYNKKQIVTLYQNALYKVAKWIVYEELVDVNGDAITMYLDYDSAISAAGWDIYGYNLQYKDLSVKQIEKLILQKKKKKELLKYLAIKKDYEDEIHWLEQFLEGNNEDILREIKLKLKDVNLEIKKRIDFLNSNHLINEEIKNILLEYKVIKPTPPTTKS